MVSNEEKPSPENHNICNEIISGDSEKVNVTCTYNNRITKNLRGRYVTIQKKSTAQTDRSILNFCEVEVFSCRRNSWGINLPEGNSDCSKVCNCEEAESCRTSDGYCHTGCKDMWWGFDCNTRCNCGVQPCDRNSGSCPQGILLSIKLP